METKLAGAKIKSQTNCYKRVSKGGGFSKYIVHCPKKIILKLTMNYLKTMYRMLILAPFILLPLTGIGGSMILTTPLNVPYAEAQGQNTSLATPEPSMVINVTIGDLIVEGPATSIGFRVLDLGTPNTGPKIEASFIGNATIRGGINATDMGTLQTIVNSDGTSYSEGKGILTSVATGEIATYTFQAIGQYGSDGKLRNHGSVFFNSNTTSSGQLSFLNNMVGVFADEIDAAGNSMTRVWELR